MPPKPKKTKLISALGIAEIRSNPPSLLTEKIEVTQKQPFLTSTEKIIFSSNMKEIKMLTSLLIIRYYLSILEGETCSQSEQEAQFELKFEQAFNFFSSTHETLRNKFAPFTLRILSVFKVTATEKLNGEQMRKKASVLKREALNTLQPAWAQ